MNGIAKTSSLDLHDAEPHPMRMNRYKHESTLPHFRLSGSVDLLKVRSDSLAMTISLLEECFSCCHVCRNKTCKTTTMMYQRSITISHRRSCGAAVYLELEVDWILGPTPSSMAKERNSLREGCSRTEQSKGRIAVELIIKGRMN